MDDVVRLVRDIADDTGRVIPAGTHGTVRQEVATGMIVEFCIDEPPAAVSAVVAIQDVEFLWRDADNPVILPEVKLQPWLPHFRRRIADKSKKEPLGWGSC